MCADGALPSCPGASALLSLPPAQPRFPIPKQTQPQSADNNPQTTSVLVSPLRSICFYVPRPSQCPFLLPACDCNPRGIQTPQCDRATGQCICNEGVEGPRCDKCSRGYSGFFPDCVPCHQCFALWDVIVGELTNRTQQFLDRANALKITGVVGPYQQTLSTLEEKLGEIKAIIAQNPAAEPLKNIGNLFEEAE